MGKNTFFIGQPVFNQLLNFIPQNIISSLVAKHKTDKYYKQFKTNDHLVTMLYSCFHKCNSLREITTGMQVSYEKLFHLGLKNIPKRSTLSDANRNRSADFFAELYHSLYKHYYHFLSDSRPMNNIEKQLYILDSTTIKLFSDIMKGAGSMPQNGKRKGGAKAHVLLNSNHDLPCLVRITEARQNDKIIFPYIQLPPQSIIVFDRAYRYYKIWEQFTKNKITWVTRAIGDEYIVIDTERVIAEDCKQYGIVKDEHITLGRGINKATILKARRIQFIDPVSNKNLIFFTNNSELSPSQIAMIYKQRWQIEVFFKRLKQHNQLRYFLGDNANPQSLNTIFEW